jgi:hypothetical protein
MPVRPCRHQNVSQTRKGSWRCKLLDALRVNGLLLAPLQSLPLATVGPAASAVAFLHSSRLSGTYLTADQVPKYPCT